MSHSGAWTALALMGAYHGLNPAMGWLFATALGLQERRASAVLRALPPIALGHAASIALVLAAFGGAGLVVSGRALRLASAAALFGFGAYLLLRRDAHPRWVGMRVGFRDLTLWSFLMSSAHGAGLMLLPAVAALSAAREAGHPTHEPLGRAVHAATLGGAAALGVHTLSLLIVTAVLALVMFRTARLDLLRRAWVNLETVWVAALLAAGVLTLALG